MSAKAPSYAQDLQADRLCFFGTLLATLAYGALLMLYVQLTGVLIARPKHGITFWAVVTYSAFVFPLATLAISTIFQFSEESYIENQNYPGGPIAFYRSHFSDYVNVLGEVSATLFAWLSDVLMLVRLMLIWNFSKWISLPAVLLYVSKLGVSIPLMIAVAQSTTPAWSWSISTSYHSITLAFNIYITGMICFRLRMLRPKLEAVAGKLHASFYTSVITTIVESGGFFTVWMAAYLIARSRDSLVQYIFYFSIPFTQGVTRMLIILRIAQDRAWSRYLVASIHKGVLDWQISSTHSIPLYDVPSTSDFSHSSDGNKVLQKF